MVMDAAGLIATPVAAAIALAQVKLGAARLPLTYRIWDRLGILPVRQHYYQPVLRPGDLPKSLWTQRSPLHGVDLNVRAELELLSRFCYADELLAFPRDRPERDDLGFYYSNPNFPPGDAETLYNVIRHFKPRRVIEIGSGMSSRMVHHGLVANRADGVAATHVCIEPYEMPWLERLEGTQVLRARVEHVDPSVFQALDDGDILFIDSSHVLRTGGDVCFEYLELLPTLRPGVIVHVHDIFLPFEYPEEWIRARTFWTEQYLLQAFLAFNSEFETLLAVHYLATHHRRELAHTAPIFAQSGARPGSFWLRRRRPAVTPS